MHIIRLAYVAALVVLLVVIPACGGESAPGTFAVTVKLATPSRPASDFDEVITSLMAVDPASSPQQMAARVSAGEDYTKGLAVAVFVDVPPGDYEINMALYLDGSVIAQEVQPVSVASDVVVNVEVAVSCDPFESACGDLRDNDCDGLADCQDPDCSAKSCSTQCIAQGLCAIDGSCEQVEAVDCDDGNPCTDDYCDADTGCQNVPNVSACDDGNACTQNDVCSDGVCAGQDIACDDGNPCTDDSCEPSSGCVQQNNVAACDDGSWCNGPDVCDGGTCSGHPDPPCGNENCNETMMACVACNVDGDCGAVTRGTWSTCDYANTCDEEAMRTREVNTPRCLSNSCTTIKSTETESCARSRNGVSCGATSTTNYGACGGYSNACDATGTQSRTVTVKVCRTGNCRSESSTQMRSCTRSVPGEGKACALDVRYRCCSGSCVNTTNNPNHCGLCGLRCPTGQCAPSVYKKLGACVSSTTANCPPGFSSYRWATCPADDSKCDCNADSCAAYGGLCSEAYSVSLFDVCYYPGMESYLQVTTCN